MDYACRVCGRRADERTCAEHRRKRKADTRPGSYERGYDAAWRRTRARYLADHPVCECADPTCSRPASDVHHVDGLGPRGPRGHDPDNLEALAHSCHSAHTAAETPAGWNAAKGAA